MNIHASRPFKARFAGLGVMLAASLSMAQAASPTAITRVYIVTVPPAQDHAFNEGIKSWEKCLHDQGAKQAIVAYDAQTGDLGRYLFLERHSAWSEMDNHEAADKACAPTFRSEVLPHFTQGLSRFAALNAKDTYMPGGDPDPAPMLWVNAFRIKSGQAQAFGDVMAKFAAAAAKVHWHGHFGGYDVEGAGEGGLHFALVWPNKSWADIGRDPTPSIKDMMDSVYGKAVSRALHAKYAAAIEAQWDEAWSYEKDLSYVPGK